MGLLVTVANFGYMIQHGFNALGLAGFAFALIGFGLFVAGRFASSKISAEMLTMIGLLVTTIGVVLGLVGAIRKAVDDPFLSAFSVLIAVISVWTGFMSFNRIV